MNPTKSAAIKIFSLLLLLGVTAFWQSAANAAGSINIPPKGTGTTPIGPVGDAPNQMPAIDGGVGLVMMSGKSPWDINDTSVGKLTWGTHIGFGERRFLNILSKIQLTTDNRFARLWNPKKLAIDNFEKTGGEGWAYKNIATTFWCIDTRIVFEDFIEDVPQTAKVIFPDGGYWKYEYESFIAAVGDLAGRTYRIIEKTDKNGYKTTISYNASNIQITDASGNLGASGHVYTCAFDSLKRITRIAVNGRTWDYTYDSNKITEINNQSGKTIETWNDIDGKVLRMKTSCNGAIRDRQYLYDEDGAITKTIKEGDLEVLNNVTEEEDGSKTTAVTNAGNTSYFTDSEFGRTSVKDGNGNETTYVRNRYFQPTRLTDPRGYTWTYQYDDNGYKTREECPDGGVWQYSYDDNYNMTRKITPAGTWDYEYDSNNQLTKRIHSDGSIQEFYLDANGLATKIVDAGGNTILYWYNLRGQITKRKGPFNGIEPAEYYSCEYDSWGNMTHETDEAGNSKSYYYDSADHLTRVTDCLGNSKDYYYDGLGRLTKRVNEDGGFITWEHDIHGNMTRMTNEKGIVSNCMYDDAGRVTKEISSNNVETVYYYDNAGWKTRIARDFGGLNQNADYEYDANGNLTRTTDANGKTSSFSYDPINRVNKKTNPIGEYTEYFYDQSGLVTKVTDSAGGESNTYYDSMAKITRQSVKASSSLTYETEFRYDSNGLMTRRISANNVISDYEYNPRRQLTRTIADVGGLNRITENYYDSVGRLTRTVSDPSGQNFASSFAYDSASNLISVTDPMGHSTSYSYDEMGRKTRITDASGNSTQYLYDKTGRVTRIAGYSSVNAGLGDYFYNDSGILTRYTDLNGNSTDSYYDALNRNTRITDALNNSTDYAYDAAYNITSKTDANGKTVTYSHDDIYRVTRITDETGKSSEFQYDAANRTTMVTDAAGGSVKTYYDLLGRVTKTTDALNGDSLFEYDPASNLTRKTNPDNTVTTYIYDNLNQLTRAVADAGGIGLVTDNYYDAVGRMTRTVSDPTGQNIHADFAYDNNSRLTRTTSHLGGNTDYAYDNVGRQTRIVDAAGRSVSSTYNAAGWLTEASNGVTTTNNYYDSIGVRTRTSVSGRAPVDYYYDDAYRLTRTSRTDGVITVENTSVYDAVGRLTASTDAAGKTTTYSYDDVGRLTRLTDAESEATDYAYDDVGRKTQESYANGTALTYAYDLAGQLTLTSGGAKGTSTYSYDNLGRLTRTTDANSRSRDTYYDTLGRVTRTENEMDQAVTYGYDILGRRTSLADANGNTTQYFYDNDSRLTRMQYPNANVEDYDYDASGKLTRKVTPKGDNIDYAYNAAGAVSSQSFGETVSYSYDAAGALVQTTGSNTTMGYAYDSFGRMTRASDSGLSRNVDYAYDLRGLRTRMSGDIGANVDYFYDDAGRVTKVKKAGEMVGAVYEYDAGGRRTKLFLDNGVYTEYAYTSNNRLTGLVTKDSGDTVLESYAYTYDNAGNRVAVSLASGENIAYGYDNAYRLTTETRTGADSTVKYAETLWYDNVGNRTRQIKGDNGTTETFEYAYSNANQLTRKNNTINGDHIVYNYDPNGNQVEQISYDNTDTITATEYTAYDNLNRRTGWEKIVSGETNKTESFSYRGASFHRHSQTADGVTTHFLHDGDDVIADIENGSIARSYVTPFLDENVSVTIHGATPTVHYYTHDGLGSVRGVGDSSGAVENRYDYNAFGEKYAPNTSETIAQRYGFTGRENNPESDTMHYRNRTYSPTNGRFISRDPGGYANNVWGNLYAYCYNSPTNAIDPYGLIDRGSLGQQLVQDLSRDRLINGNNGQAQYSMSFGMPSGVSGEFSSYINQRTGGSFWDVNDGETYANSRMSDAMNSNEHPSIAQLHFDREMLSIRNAIIKGEINAEDGEFLSNVFEAGGPPPPSVYPWPRFRIEDQNKHQDTDHPDEIAPKPGADGGDQGPCGKKGAGTGTGNKEPGGGDIGGDGEGGGNGNGNGNGGGNGDGNGGGGSGSTQPDGNTLNPPGATGGSSSGGGGTFPITIPVSRQKVPPKLSVTVPLNIPELTTRLSDDDSFDPNSVNIDGTSLGLNIDTGTSSGINRNNLDVYVPGALGRTGQGLLNTINGVQDQLIGAQNQFIDITTGPILPYLIDVPHIPSPDWSYGSIYEETDRSHWWSKLLGGAGATALAGAYLPKIFAPKVSPKTGLNAPPEAPAHSPGSLGAAKAWTIKGRLNYHQLPTRGKIRYVPPKNYTPGQPLPRGPQGGLLDRFGNEWVRGPSRTAGQAFEWDVQLGRNATPGMRSLSSSGSHVNVSLDGRVTH
jgi:RHS repeat-associated protein